MTNAPTVKKEAPRKRKAVSLEKRKARSGWFFILPFVIGFLIIYFPMLVESIAVSFCDYKAAVGRYQLSFIGFSNYHDALFKDTQFVQVLLTGLKQLAFDIPAIVVFSLFMAVLLNKKMFGRAAFRAIFFIPVILATGVIAGIDASNILNTNMESAGSRSGAEAVSNTVDIVDVADITWLFRNMQVGTELLDYVVGVVNNIYNIINRSGVQMLIFLAGLQSISPAIYESCSIDGATAWETFWKITFPMISPMILVNALYTTIDSFTSSSNSVMSYISQIYTGTGGRTLASAMSWIYFTIVILIIALLFAIFSVYVFYQKRD